MARHIITALDESHELVQQELNSPLTEKVLHKLRLSEEELRFPVKTAFAIRQQVTNLPLKVGDETVIITEDDQAVIEMLSVCFLQRRFNECIKVIVKRRSGEFLIPYLTNLRPGEGDEKEGMVDYNYGTSSSCGSCSSCG